MILKEFVKVDYDGATLADIFRPLEFYSKQMQDSFVFSDYSIEGDDRPEYLAYSNGGNPELTWLYLHTNQVTDPFWGWVANETAIRELTVRRYDDPNGLHHHIRLSTGEEWFDLVEYPIGTNTYYDAGDTSYERIAAQGVFIPVTNYEYELEENEKKRTIKSLTSGSFLNFDRMMKQVIKESVDVNKQ
ncbi:baseplate wedge subunit [Paraglaciecola Antarctic GD virus 1]|nr:baseplate wedge subunit [Paraglaciecola Antarctic GD virus 1]